MIFQIKEIFIDIDRRNKENETYVYEKKIVVTGGHLQMDNLQFIIFYDLGLESQRIHVVNK